MIFNLIDNGLCSFIIDFDFSFILRQFHILGGEGPQYFIGGWQYKETNNKHIIIATIRITSSWLYTCASYAWKTWLHLIFIWNCVIEDAWKLGCLYILLNPNKKLFHVVKKNQNYVIGRLLFSVIINEVKE